MIFSTHHCEKACIGVDGGPPAGRFKLTGVNDQISVEARPKFLAVAQLQD